RPAASAAGKRAERRRLHAAPGGTAMARPERPRRRSRSPPQGERRLRPARAFSWSWPLLPDLWPPAPASSGPPLGAAGECGGTPGHSVTDPPFVCYYSRLVDRQRGGGFL